MIRLIDFKTIIEKTGTHEKYYPHVVSFNTVDSLPLTSPHSLKLVVMPPSNLSGVQSVSLVEFDDIIRLQACVRFHVLEKPVWVDIFEGRIQNPSKTLGTSLDINFDCVGHLTAAFDALCAEDKAFTNVDATAILSYICTIPGMERISYYTGSVETGTTVTEFNLKKETSYAIDGLKDLEKLSGYTKMIGIDPKYTSSGDLITCNVTWNTLSMTPVESYKIIEGSPRLLSASFDIVGEDVKNYRFVKGGTNTTGTQYAGKASDSVSIAKYGYRFASDQYGWIESDSLCNSIAHGLLQDSNEPYVAGQTVLEFTPDAKIGDLVQVKIPSLEIRGNQVEGNYTVYRVSHSYSGGQARTTLDLGRIKKNEYDYIAGRLTQIIQIAYKNQIL